MRATILVASSMQGRNETHVVRDVKMEEAEEQKTERARCAVSAGATLCSFLAYQGNNSLYLPYQRQGTAIDGIFAWQVRPVSAFQNSIIGTNQNQQAQGLCSSLHPGCDP